MGTSSQTDQDLGRTTAAWIARRMEALDWDFERLAVETGMSWGTLASYRADASGMSMNELAAIAQALGTDVLTLIGEVAMRERHGCPDWCIRTDHSPGEDPDLHYGPEFGPIWPQGLDEADLGATFDPGALAEAEFDADALRALADNALAAAQWLEAVR